MRLVVFGLYIFFYFVHGHSSQDGHGHSWRDTEHHNHNHNEKSLLDQVLDKHWKRFQASDLAKDILAQGGFSKEKKNTCM